MTEKLLMASCVLAMGFIAGWMAALVLIALGALVYSFAFMVTLR